MQEESEAIEIGATLDPPGTIAVIGAGPLGIEAALYGRFLGYNVTLFEADALASHWRSRREEQIPMLPDRCVSPLARGALDAQVGDGQPKQRPLTIGEWIDEVWSPLCQSDLLRGRLQCPVRVTAVELVDASVDEAPAEGVSGSDEMATDDDADDQLPPDFRLRFAEGGSEDFEAVIDATGSGESESIPLSFDLPADYFFRLGSTMNDDARIDAEVEFWTGLKQIVDLYASLGGRTDLDLYRPRRS